MRTRCFDKDAWWWMVGCYVASVVISFLLVYGGV